MGQKEVWYSSNILLEQVDVESLSEGVTVTLINWGNAVITTVNRSVSYHVLVKGCFWAKWLDTMFFAFFCLRSFFLSGVSKVILAKNLGTPSMNAVKQPSTFIQMTLKINEFSPYFPIFPPLHFVLTTRVEAYGCTCRLASSVEFGVKSSRGFLPFFVASSQWMNCVTQLSSVSAFMSGNESFTIVWLANCLVDMTAIHSSFHTKWIKTWLTWFHSNQELAGDEVNF